MQDTRDKSSRPLRRSLTLITIAGSLAMVYGAGISSPAYSEFLRAVGARELHFGILGGIPMIMLGMQFFGALLADRVPRRKPWFMATLIGGRLLYLPMALVPVLLPGLGTECSLWTIIALAAVSSGLTNVTGPLWATWMADLIPHRILNRYWGARQRALHIVWTASFLGVAAFSYRTRLPIIVSFPLLATVAVAAGVVDILLFARVHEPPNRMAPPRDLFSSLRDTLRHRDVRHFLVFSCAWSAVAMFSAAFLQIYVLKDLGLTVWRTTLVWCAAGVGMTIMARQWGRLADRYGHRPVLVTCMLFKPLIVVVFLLVDARTAMWILPPAMMVDAIWNSGIGVAQNGYMMKNAPMVNRSMFMGAMTGLTGICGGLGSMLGGAFLHAYDGSSLPLFGRQWGSYHLLFFVNFFMRLLCLPLALRVREPVAASSSSVLYALSDMWPMRYLLFPVGLYRRFGPNGRKPGGR